MKLVIAEKPSVGRGIAAAVGATSRKDGYIEGGDYAITWCRGHLVDLATPGSYEVWAGSWSLEKLPMIPDKWIWEPVKESGAEDQLAIIKKLAERDDVDAIVNACDADREGEGIFRRVYDYLGLKKPVVRFWSTSLVDDAVRKDLSRMKPGSEYDGLGNAAEGRAKADWLVGMNGSRVYTLTYNAKPALSVGRVQTPVLAMVVEQTRKVENFVSEPFWRVLADLGGFSVSSERFDKKEDAYALAGSAEAAGKARVTGVERKDVKAKPPSLYDLTSLQRDASTRCGMTADATLAALQSLYEKKLATYPRTDSKYITSDDADEAAALLPRIAVAGIVGGGAAAAFDMGRADIERVVNDKKVAGHGAILPTSELDAKAMDGLSGDERNVMLLVCGRLLAAVMEPGMRTHTKVAVEIAGTEFKASGSIVKDASWVAVDDAVRASLRGGEKTEAEPDSDSDNERIPADVNEGDVLTISGVSVKEGKTSAPKHYTDATLLSAMENAGREIEDADLKAAINDDSSHSGGLGTPATRADTIERLIDKGYCERKGRSIIATQTGKDLIDTVADSLKSPVLTAEWEAQLSRIEREGASLGEFLDRIASYTKDVVREAHDAFDPGRLAAKTVGTCPLCGKPVVPSSSGKSWHCVDQRWDKRGGKFEQVGTCTFSIGRVAGKQLTEKQVKDLLSGRSVHAEGLRSKKGSTFETDLVLDEAGKVVFSWSSSPKAANKNQKSGKR